MVFFVLYEMKRHQSANPEPIPSAMYYVQHREIVVLINQRTTQITQNFDTYFNCEKTLTW